MHWTDSLCESIRIFHVIKIAINESIDFEQWLRPQDGCDNKGAS